MTSEAIFNNREVALGIWAAMLLAWGLSNQGIRSSLKVFVRAFSQPAILRVYAAMVGYVAAVIAGLRAIGLCEVRQWKDTIIWFVFVAGTAVFQLPRSADVKSHANSHPPATES